MSKCSAEFREVARISQAVPCEELTFLQHRGSPVQCSFGSFGTQGPCRPSGAYFISYLISVSSYRYLIFLHITDGVSFPRARHSIENRIFISSPTFVLKAMIGRLPREESEYIFIQDEMCRILSSPQSQMSHSSHQPDAGPDHESLPRTYSIDSHNPTSDRSTGAVRKRDHSGGYEITSTWKQSAGLLDESAEERMTSHPRTPLEYHHPRATCERGLVQSRQTLFTALRAPVTAECLLGR
ncbi:hypothetical protein BDP67DRAFT_18372 [Colletotrichum lupini]|nr:hypothetical protein BDP67DRAFT_18372 [Colletotrichum lupini]